MIRSAFRAIARGLREALRLARGESKPARTWTYTSVGGNAVSYSDMSSRGGAWSSHLTPEERRHGDWHGTGGGGGGSIVTNGSTVEPTVHGGGEAYPAPGQIIQITR